MSFEIENDNNVLDMQKKYSALMKMRQSARPSLSQASRSQLRSAVFQLVTSRQNTDSLLSEILQLRTTDSSHVGRATDSSHVGLATDSSHVGPATDSSHVKLATDSSHVGSATDSSHVGPATDSSHMKLATDSSDVKLATDSSHMGSATDSSHVGTATDSCSAAPAISPSSPNVTVLLPAVSQCLYQESTAKCQTSSIAAAETCAGKIVEMIRHNDFDSSCKELVTPLNLEKLTMCLHLVQKFIEEQQFSRTHFITVLSRESSLPLEVIWRLHTSGVLVLDSFFSNKLVEDGFSQDFANQLFCLCSHQRDSGPVKDDIMKGFISFLVNHGFPEKRKKEESFGSLKKVCISIVDGLTKNFLAKPGETSLLRYACLTPSAEISPVSVRKFCTHTLSLIMSYKPCLKVSQALKQQRNWKSAKVEACISSFYKQLFIPFAAGDVLEILQRVLDRQEVNWETLLSFLATYLVCFPGAPQLISDHISSVLKEGLENCEMENTIVAFLLARQCCVEGVHIFPTYQDWFQKTFGDGSRSPASSRKSFTFLMKFLTDIVPYETGKHLKVHIVRPPYVPPKCRDLLSDYVALAKTRLADLKETLNDDGIYEVSTAGQSDTKQSLLRSDQDVLTAITAFESTGKVPSSVMEASIFRKPYFIGKFLPALLKARPLPDKRDSRMKMIDALKKADKIPLSLYAKYEEGCRKEAQQLLNGVFEQDHDDMEDMMLEPRDQLVFRLGQLQDVIVNTASVQSSPLKQKVSELISIISEKIELVLGRLSSEELQVESTHTPISLSFPDVKDTHIQIVDLLVNFISRCLTLDLQTPTPQLTWLLQLTRMLSEHKTLYHALFTRFLCLVHQGQNLKDHHLTGLSALAACLAVLQPLFGIVTVDVCSVCQSHKSTGSFLDVLLDVFPYWTAASAELYWRFWSQYLKFVFLQFERVSSCYRDDRHGVIPADLTRKFTFLCWRFLPHLRTHGHSGDVRSDHKTQPHVTCLSHKFDEMLPHVIYLSDRFQQCVRDIQIDFDSWINFEITISPDDDNLSYFERRAFHEWVIHQHFLQAKEVDGGFNYNHTRLSTVLFQAVLKCHMRSSCEGIPACARCKKKGDHSCKTNGLEFLSFLQILVHHLSSVEETPAIPWLLRQLDKFLSSGNRDNSILEQAKIGVFFRVVSVLPPHLFLSDQLGILPDQQTMQEVISRVERYMIHLVEGCALSISVTSYLLQGLISLRRSASLGDTLRSLTTHRLMSVSCLVHWDTVRSLLSSWSEEDDELFSHLHQVKHWFNRSVGSKHLESIPHHLPSWLCAAELFAAVVDGKRVDDVAGLLANSDNHHVEVMVSLCEILLSFLSGLHTSNKKNNENVTLRQMFVKILSRHPGILSDILNENKEIDLVSRSMATHTASGHTLLGLLALLDTQHEMDIFKHESNLKCVVHIFQQVCVRFETGASEVTNRTTQPISLTEVMSHAEFIRKILLRVPLPCLYTLDKSSLLSCGFDIKLTVDRRLASGH
ncbi:Fanconi anemia group A protein-like [Gigantopelta aegis]|uniref:Fanconi anemia group A protein-like n=1 Tax=Gigantopelta aegis TaxID=1735272 RepID=UPI001B88B6F1|nr:Fanconi anemia group A protein-like [Gigantopelta aegis]